MDPLSWIIIVLIVVVGIYSIIKLNLEHKLKSEEQSLKEVKHRLDILESRVSPGSQNDSFHSQEEHLPTQVIYNQEH